MLIILGDIIAGAIGAGSPTIPLIPTQRGPLTASCTVIAGASSCTSSTITFSPSYTQIPLVTATVSALSPGVVVHATSVLEPSLITFQTPGNDTSLFFDSETPVQTTNIPNTDTVLKSYSPAGLATYPSNMIVEGEGWITTSATSTKQVINVLVNNNGIGFVQTIQFETESLSIGNTPFAIKAVTAPIVFTTSLSIDVCSSTGGVGTCTGGATDANTQIVLASMRIYGVQTGFRTWQNMPSATTEIYGSSGTNDRQQFNFQSGTGVTMTFCVNVVSQTTTAAAQLTPYAGGLEISTGLRVTVGTNGAVGLQCAIASVTLTAGQQTVTLFGGGGGVLADFPPF